LKKLFKRLIYYVNLYGALFSISLSSRLQYRVDFIVTSIGYLLYLGANVALFGVVYQWTTYLGGWSFNEILIFLGTYHTIHGIWDFATALNVEQISSHVAKGSLDMILIKPVSSLFYVTFNNMNFSALINVVAGIVIAVSGAVMRGDPIALGTVFLYVLLCFCGVVIFTVIQLLVQLISFRLIRSDTINSFFYQVIKFAEKPTVIYTGIPRFVLTFMIPMIIIVNVPSELLMGKATAGAILFSLLVTTALLLIASIGWRFSVKAYSSTN